MFANLQCNERVVAAARNSVRWRRPRARARVRTRPADSGRVTVPRGARALGRFRHGSCRVFRHGFVLRDIACPRLHGAVHAGSCGGSSVSECDGRCLPACAADKPPLSSRTFRVVVVLGDVDWRLFFLKMVFTKIF